ncbi:MAG: hypothetical protein QW786_02345 [Candidatus Hadarchaeum sp.]
MKDLVEFYKKALSATYNAKRLGLQKCVDFFQHKYVTEQELLQELVEHFRKNRSLSVPKSVYESLQFESLQDFVNKTQGIKKTKGLRTIAQTLIWCMQNSTGLYGTPMELQPTVHPIVRLEETSDVEDRPMRNLHSRERLI